jgi:hypothetical protein
MGSELGVELRSTLLAMTLMFTADIVALGWVAMWLSLKCRRQADVAGLLDPTTVALAKDYESLGEVAHFALGLVFLMHDAQAPL